MQRICVLNNERLKIRHVESPPTGDELYALNGDKVCRLFGEVILRSTSGMELPEFLNMWGLSVPEGRERVRSNIPVTLLMIAF